MTPTISFIVSVYDRTAPLWCQLASLALQTVPHEVIVTEAHKDPDIRRQHDLAIAQFGGRCLYTPDLDCYAAAERVIRLGMARGEWLCFPSDDGYCVPDFAAIMLHAAEKHGWGLVYCDAIYDPRMNGQYDVLRVAPRLNHIDKTCFMVRRSAFRPFPRDREWIYCDGRLVEDLVAAGVAHGKAPGVLVVHN